MAFGSAWASAKLGSEERMIRSKRYVQEDSQGALRVGSLGVSLDSVVIAFQQGHAAESLQQLYPALSLEEVHGAIAYTWPIRTRSSNTWSSKNSSGIKCVSAPRRIPAP
jgi:hypothetical protein